MRKQVCLLSLAALVLLALGAGYLVTRPPGSMAIEEGPASVRFAATGMPETQPRGMLATYGKLPLSFVPNRGQTHPRVRYYAQGAGYGVYFTREEAVLALSPAAARPASRVTRRDDARPEVLLAGTRGTTRDTSPGGVALALRFLGASPAVTVEGRQEGTGKVNYLIGNDPARWRTGLSTYEEVVYRELWPGVDLAFRGTAGQLKYEFRLDPGAPVESIRLTYRGAERLALDGEGNLQIETALGTLTEERPVSWQEIGGRRVPVESRFLLKRSGGGESVFGFEIGAGYDARYPLIIDPTLVYSTYLGGSASDVLYGIATSTDAFGTYAYVVGSSQSTNFPVTTGAVDTSSNGKVDVVVTKLNAAGTALVYATYLGGSQDDAGKGVAVDSLGRAWVTGETSSANFPTTPGALDTTFGTTGTGNGIDAFVAKLNADGSGLLYSTYLGGSGGDRGWGVAVDGADNVYVTGPASANFQPIVNAFDANPAGGDGYLTKLDANGAVVYSTFLGGSGQDYGQAVAADAAGYAYVTGVTDSPDLAPPQTAPTGNNAFVMKVSPTGSLVYSTYVGGSGGDFGRGIAADGSGNAYVTGFTGSSNFPTPGGFDTSLAGNNDAFVTKLSAGGTVVYSSFLGGNNIENAFAIAVDGAGNAYVTGLTDSTDFLRVNALAVDPGRHAFVAKVNTAATGASSLVYSTYLGGSRDDVGYGIATRAGNAYVAGGTSSSNFPTTSGAYDTNGTGVTNNAPDGFVAKLSD